jgi:hypothetical protein
MVTLICNKCGWAHFGMTRQRVINSVEEFLQYYNNLPQSDRISYYGSGSLSFKSLYDKYLKCFRCGNYYDNFHPETEEDRIPIGVTMQPIVSTHPDAA